MGGIITSALQLSPRASPRASPRLINGASGPADPNALKESWQEVKKIGVEKIGAMMFIKLFELHPEAFQMFKTFRDQTEWKSSKALLSHSRLVLNVIGNALLASDQKDLQTRMFTIGSAHAVFDIKEEYFIVMKAELINQLQSHLKEKFTKEVKFSWETAFDNFEKAMKTAMASTSTK
jgi:hemoglobin-like flavoprotein